MSDKMSLPTLTRITLIKYDGNVDRTVRSLDRELKNDPQLRRSVIDEAIKLAIQVHALNLVRRERSSLLDEANERLSVSPVGAAVADRFSEPGLALARSLLDLPLMGIGIKLRDASIEQFREQVDHWMKQGSDLLHKSRFGQKLLSKWNRDPKKLGGQIFNPSELDKVWGETS